MTCIEPVLVHVLVLVHGFVYGNVYVNVNDEFSPMLNAQ